MSVVENGVVMALICLDQSLKTAKYIAVFNLAFVDVFGNSALVPKVIDTFWFNHKYITYNNCLTYEFFNYMTLTMQSLNLVLLSFDRLVAITFPLRYHVIVSLKTMFLLVAFFWIFGIFVNLIAVGLLTRLSFCRAVSCLPNQRRSGSSEGLGALLKCTSAVDCSGIEPATGNPVTSPKP
ncbi:Olfactory receptor 2A12 [Merluccius polli]|uniref:Olfactory receptor 2A12 n=1 Tax=Merluccius polli TaxID=89951 RepID=A0AA47MN73_MERPO|nr:Olfactory receptor 2A12 [Merluccius polli]